MAVAQPSRPVTAPAIESAGAKPKPTPAIVALAFVVSAALGFGATVLASQFLG